MKLLFSLWKKHTPPEGDSSEKIIDQYIGSPDTLVCEGSEMTQGEDTEYSVRLWDGREWVSIWATKNGLDWSIRSDEYKELKDYVFSR